MNFRHLATRSSVSSLAGRSRQPYSTRGKVGAGGAAIAFGVNGSRSSWLALCVCRVSLSARAVAGLHYDPGLTSSDDELPVRSEGTFSPLAPGHSFLRT